MGKKKINRWRHNVALLCALGPGTLYAKEIPATASFFQANCIQYQPVLVKPHLPKVTLQTGNPPSLEKAYKSYLKTGKAPNVITDGFVQFAFGAQQPIIPTSPFALSVISLEPGEQVANVSSGDPLRWSYSLAYSGDKTRQAHIMVKPSLPNISTDLVIITDKRFYTLKLVSKEGDYYRDVRFWYPNDIQQKINEDMQNKADKIASGYSPMLQKNALDVSRLNFNYEVKCPLFGLRPSWYPVRIFDDGKQTYIQFPATLEQSDLPALFVQRDQYLLISNFRVKAPYFIVDGLFERAALISGTGKNQQRITLINQGMRI